jgi:hypothetical protein
MWSKNQSSGFYLEIMATKKTFILVHKIEFGDAKVYGRSGPQKRQ